MKGFRFNQTCLRRVESDTTFEIEDFVNKLIQQTERVGLTSANQRDVEDVIRFFYSDLRRMLPGSLFFYRPHLYDYSEHLEAFFHGCKAAGIMEVWQQEGASGIHKLTTKQLNQLIDATITYTQSTAFKRKQYDRRHEAKENGLSLRECFTAWQNYYSRIYVVRVDFYYHERYRPGITILEVYKHLKQLNYHMSRRLGIFAHLATYCRKVEQARTNGYHIHIGFYFKGHCHQNAYLLVDYMQGLWADITFGQGYCYSSNFKEKDFEAKGTNALGMIYRHDVIKREKSLVAMTYMTELKEPSQHLRMRPKRKQVFVRGQMPSNVSRKIRKKRQMLIRSLK